MAESTDFEWDNKYYYVLFDGDCMLCNQSIQHILKHDDQDLFRFVALQHPLAAELVASFGFKPENLDTVYIFHDGILHYKSNAALLALSKINSPMSWLKYFKVLPVCPRDNVYNLVAKLRYKIWGKTNACELLTPEIQHKFLV